MLFLVIFGQVPGRFADHKHRRACAKDDYYGVIKEMETQLRKLHLPCHPQRAK